MAEQLMLNSAALTDPGTQRTQNEDVVFHHTDWNPIQGGTGLFVVADGIGGHPGGDRASELALHAVTSTLLVAMQAAASNGNIDWRHELQAGVERANDAIWQETRASSSGPAQMGTTIAIALIVHNVARIASVGDSRVYAWRKGSLVQITRDHSLAAALQELGQVEPDELASHPRSHVLSRALGQKEDVLVDLFEWPLQRGDRLLLCSDGLWRPFSQPDELADRLGVPGAPQQICSQLVLDAVARDGSDNVSAIVVDAQDQNRVEEEALRTMQLPLPGGSPSVAETVEPVPAG